MDTRFVHILITVVIACTFIVVKAETGQEKEVDNWEPVRFLLGEWKGEGKESKVEHTYEFVLQDKFIRSRTRAEFEPKEDEERGEVHEDMGFFSYDSDRDKIVFRQFLSEGFVNTYVLEPVESKNKKLVFNSESTESAGGMLARLTIEIITENEYRMLLDLASPGKDFFNCQIISMKRIQ